MQKTTLYLPSDLERELKAAARQDGRPVAELIREALQTYLSHRPDRPRPSFVGSGDDAELSARQTEDWLGTAWSKR
jgi:Ribbon-helix-helix protein, copG family